MYEHVDAIDRMIWALMKRPMNQSLCTIYSHYPFESFICRCHSFCNEKVRSSIHVPQPTNQHSFILAPVFCSSTHLLTSKDNDSYLVLLLFSCETNVLKGSTSSSNLVIWLSSTLNSEIGDLNLIRLT